MALITVTDLGDNQYEIDSDDKSRFDNYIELAKNGNNTIVDDQQFESYFDEYMVIE